MNKKLSLLILLLVQGTAKCVDYYCICYDPDFGSSASAIDAKKACAIKTTKNKLCKSVCANKYPRADLRLTPINQKPVDNDGKVMHCPNSLTPTRRKKNLTKVL